MLSRITEICAPVGCMESLRAAIDAGADSVYLGIGQMNMRSASAYNFTLQDLPYCIRLCREHRLKLYVTVNSVIYDEEIPLMMQLIQALAESGVDAVIATDVAVMNECRKYGLSVHASTQLNISNIEAVKFYAQYCDVMVLARELNLRQIANICRFIEQENICGPSGHPVRIEVFAHGAMCMSISGKCYLSQDLFNRSANRGDCIQVCRRPYSIVIDKDGEVELAVEEQYIFSPKDLKTIDFLDAVLEAGVSILKIEGRARSPEYVYTVTKAYKEAVEAIQTGNFTSEKIRQWNEQLSKVFHRGFWEGYYLGRKVPQTAETGGSQAEKVKHYAGKITNYFSRLQVVEVSLEASDLQVGDDVLIIGPTTGVVQFQISEIRVDFQQTSKASKGSVCSIPVSQLVRRNDKLYKLVPNVKE